MKKTGSIDAPGSSSSEYYERTSHSGSLSVEDENSDITIENGTEDIDDYIEDSLSNMCDTTIDNDAVIVDVNQSVQGQLRALSFDLTLDVANSCPLDCPTPTPQMDAAPKASTSAAAAAEAAAATAAMPLASFSGSERRHHASTSSSSSSLFVSESQKLQRAAAAVYNYRSSIQMSTEHEYAYINDIYSEDDEKVYEDLCYVTFQSKVKPEVCCLHTLQIIVLKYCTRITMFNTTTNTTTNHPKKTKNQKPKTKYNRLYVTCNCHDSTRMYVCKLAKCFTAANTQLSLAVIINTLYTYSI